MVEQTAKHRCHGGELGYYKHASTATGTEMRFTVFTPPQAKEGKRPALFFLSGLTCTEENFTTKANAYKTAAELGLVIVTPDTSPRGDDIPTGDTYELGKGAGFYLDATQEPWSRNYRMDTYITHELRELVIREFPVDAGRLGIFGHSMGGHGALVLYLRNPGMYQSVSAFAPIASPIQSPWGEKALGTYLGNDTSRWAAYDATELMKSYSGGGARPTILIDQGTEDQFLHDRLKPELFAEAAKTVDYPVELRMQEGYDHGYFFIQTFIDDHLRHHAAYLGVI